MRFHTAINEEECGGCASIQSDPTYSSKPLIVLSNSSTGIGPGSCRFIVGNGKCTEHLLQCSGGYGATISFIMDYQRLFHGTVASHPSGECVLPEVHRLVPSFVGTVESVEHNRVEQLRVLAHFFGEFGYDPLNVVNEEDQVFCRWYDNNAGLVVR